MSCSVDVDLTKELAPPPKSVLEEQVEAARRGQAVATEVSLFSCFMVFNIPFFCKIEVVLSHFFQRLSNSDSPRWRLAPTRKEQAKWDRARKGATGGSVSSLGGKNLGYKLSYIGNEK